MKTKVLVCTLLFALMWALGGCRSGAPKGHAGGGAPDFTLTDIQGKKLSLSDYRGKVVLLDFWATWCAPCLEEIPHFIDMQQRLGAQGFQAIGISMDDGPKPVQRFYEEHKLNYPVAVGDSKLADSYGGVLGLPVTFVINRDGQIRKKFVGATDPAVIEQEVVAALKQ
ncbi:MAG: TlpA disulfide reductase family protein [Candidatus Korobacteraceae bacterium]